jgi:anti-anti-sigma factor
MPSGGDGLPSGGGATRLRVLPLDRRAGLRLRGQVDASNRHELDAALRSAARSDRDLHLDLADLHYADLPAVRLLVQAATRLPRGRQMILHEPGPVIRTILHVQGWDQMRSIIVEGRRRP